MSITHRLPSLEREHQVLARHWGQLQRQMDDWMILHTRRVEKLQAELLRLRALLIVRHTQMLWGLGYEFFALPKSRDRGDTTTPRPASAEEAAQALICQTGCVGQAHAWLGPEQECRLHGGPCKQHGAAPSPPSPVHTKAPA